MRGKFFSRRFLLLGLLAQGGIAGVKGGDKSAVAGVDDEGFRAREVERGAQYR
jgi:hypothetical protein